jgi:hypothetical protein
MIDSLEAANNLSAGAVTIRSVAAQLERAMYYAHRLTVPPTVRAGAAWAALNGRIGFMTADELIAR